MNQSLNAATLAISQTTVTPVAAADVSITLNMPSSWSNKTISIGAQETQMIIQDPCGNVIKQYTYNITHNSTYTTPAVSTSSASAFCRCLKRASASYPKHNLRCAVPTETGSIHYNDATLTTSVTLSDSAFVTGILTVPSGYLLTIDDAEVSMGEGVQIVVEDGGRILIQNSNLRGCEGETWEGIKVTGHNTNASQVSITDSRITDAMVALKAIQVNSLIIMGNYFENGEQAIRLSQCKGFDIIDNNFVDFPSAINTNSAIAAASLIQENMFYEQDTSIYLEDDAHSSLDINCNGFVEYTSFGIYSNNTQLKSQGTSTTGAGNTFITSSARTNHQLSHSTNTITYYCDPSHTFTLAGTSSGYSATTSTASNNRSCTQASGRPALYQNEIGKEKISYDHSILLNCFPNPAANKITFAYLLEDKISSAEIRVSDMFGRLMKNVQLTVGSNAIEEDLSSFANGIYFYSLNVNGRNAGTKKLIVSK